MNRDSEATVRRAQNCGEVVDLVDFFRRALQGVEPGALVSEYLECSHLDGDITLLALGKSAVPMALAAKQALGQRVVEEVVVAPQIPDGSPTGWIASSHPRVSEVSVRAAEAMQNAAARAKGQILVLLSGGGSALAAKPAQGLSLSAKTELIDAVVRAGANIVEINTLRKHVSDFKGGRLAALSRVPTRTLILSDVIGDVWHMVASGPTMADNTRFADAIEIVYKYLGKAADGEALSYLVAGAQGVYPDTPKVLETGHEVTCLAGIDSLAKQVHELARKQGIEASLIRPAFEESIDSMATKVLEMAQHSGLHIGYGEPTIVLPPSVGQGGRAQQLALHLACKIRGELGLQILVVGSDGMDGNTQAAGALVDGNTFARICEAGLDPAQHLKDCNAAAALVVAKAQIHTGPTGVNHADLILIYRESP